MLPTPSAVYAVDSVGNQGAFAAANFSVDTSPPTFSALRCPSARWSQRDSPAIDAAWLAAPLPPALLNSPQPVRPHSLHCSYPAATAERQVTVTFTAADVGAGVANVTCRFRELTPADGKTSGGDQGGGDQGGSAGTDAPNGGDAPAAESPGSAKWELCTSPVTYSGPGGKGLEQGRYGLTLRATDAAGQSNTVRCAVLAWLLSRAGSQQASKHSPASFLLLRRRPQRPPSSPLSPLSN